MFKDQSHQWGFLISQLNVQKNTLNAYSLVLSYTFKFCTCNSKVKNKLENNLDAKVYRMHNTNISDIFNFY